MSPPPSSQPESLTPAKPGSKKLQTFFLRLSTTLALWLLIGSAIYFQNGPIMLVLIGAISFGGLWEIGRMLGPEISPLPFRAFHLLLAAGYLGVTTWWVLTHQSAPPYWLDLLALILSIQGTFALSYRQAPQGQHTLIQIFGNIATFAYTVLMFAFVTRLLYAEPLSSDGKVLGVWYVLLLIAITKMADTGAYAIGTLIGKHKMIPHISPGKTWQGFFGAFVGAAVATWVVHALGAQHLHALSLTDLIALILLLTLAGLSGDLAESVLKRCLNVKDSGHSLPGIGGILDLTDSLFFAAPVFYFYLILFVK